MTDASPAPATPYARIGGEAATGTAEVSVQVERLNAGVGETTRALRELRSGADRVAQQGETLRAEVGALVARLRGHTAGAKVAA